MASRGDHTDSDGLMRLVNELDTELEDITALTELAGLIDGEPAYFHHAVVLLQLCHSAAARMETSLRNLAAQLRCRAADVGGA